MQEEKSVDKRADIRGRDVNREMEREFRGKQA